MIELQGKYNSAKVFNDNLEKSSIGHLIAMLNQESIKGSKIRVMPDCHDGAGCVIGTTMTITDSVIPNIVGVDIGCFTGDTKVFTDDGYKTFKELYERNKEITTEAFDIKRKAFVYSSATVKLTRHDANLVMVTYQSELGKQTSVRCTPDHKFLINNESENYTNTDTQWIEAKELKPKMRLVANNTKVYVMSVYTLSSTEDVYCLQVPDYNNFTLDGGVIVHNCGMSVSKLVEKRIELPKLDSVIHKGNSDGFYGMNNLHKFTENIDLSKLRCAGSIHKSKIYEQLGTLGGGNHFIEIDVDDEGNKYLIVHSGSRYLGKQVCKYYQDKAWDSIKKSQRSAVVKAKAEELTKANRQGEIGEVIKNIEVQTKVPHELAYCTGELFDDYIHDMKIAEEYAYWNRSAIVHSITKAMKLHIDEEFQTVHNYIDTSNMILRKGAVSARLGEKSIIPINMRDGSLLCVGKGNEDWNLSAPHGAGRLMSRGEAKQSFTLSQFKKTMQEAGVYSTSIGTDTIDECPMAYKPMQEILDNIEPTVQVLKIIKPIYNFKAGKNREDR